MLTESPVQTSNISVAGSIPSLSQLKGASSLSNQSDNGSRIISPESQQLSDEEDKTEENPLYEAAEGLSPSSVSALNCDGHKLGIGFQHAADGPDESNDQEIENGKPPDMPESATPVRTEQTATAADGEPAIRMANTAAEASSSSGPGNIADESEDITSERLGETEREDLARKISNHSTTTVDRGNPTHIGAHLPQTSGDNVNLSLAGGMTESNEDQSEEKEPATHETTEPGEERLVLKQTRETLQKILKATDQTSEPTLPGWDGRKAPPSSESIELDSSRNNRPPTSAISATRKSSAPSQKKTRTFPPKPVGPLDDVSGTWEAVQFPTDSCDVSSETLAVYNLAKSEMDSRLASFRARQTSVAEDLTKEKLPWVVQVPGSRFYRLPWPLKTRAEGFRILPSAFQPSYRLEQL